MDIEKNLNTLLETAQSKENLDPEKEESEIIHQKTKFHCGKCDKHFYDSKSFYKHLIKKKIPCDRVIDEKQYLLRHLDILSKKYKELRMYANSDVDDNIKVKILKSTFKKCNETLKLSNDNRETLGNEYDDIIYSIKVMIQNMKTGNYDNLDIQLDHDPSEKN